MVAEALQRANERLEEYKSHPDCKISDASFHKNPSGMTVLGRNSKVCEEGCHDYLAADLEELAALEGISDSCQGHVDKEALFPLINVTTLLRLIDNARRQCPPSPVTTSLWECLTQQCPLGREFISRSCHRWERNLICAPYQEEFYSGKGWSICGKGDSCPPGSVKIGERKAGLSGILCDDLCRVQK